MTPSDAPTGAESPTPQRCGLVAIVGRPNVGKSTLLNALVGQKISITSDKAQTTRHRITGIRSAGDSQFVFVDTPGFQTRHGAALNRTLNRTVQGALAEVDVVLLVVEAGRFGADDEKVLALLPRALSDAQAAQRDERPVLLVANKLDAVRCRADLAPWLQAMQARYPFAEFVPLSARRKSDAERLLAIVRPYLPVRPWLHQADALTDRSERFLAAELIREKLFRQLGDELPYTSTVLIDRFEEEDAAASAAAGGAGRFVRIAASIVVEREAHKGMVIGAGGERLKRIGADARAELQTLLDARVFLELWVKVRSGWADDEAHLRSYGYE
jgi:GTP-binding protein Era